MLSRRAIFAAIAALLLNPACNPSSDPTEPPDSGPGGSGGTAGDGGSGGTAGDGGSGGTAGDGGSGGTAGEGGTGGTAGEGGTGGTAGEGGTGGTAGEGGAGGTAGEGGAGGTAGEDGTGGTAGEDGTGGTAGEGGTGGEVGPIAICGDEVVQPGEACDDGNQDDGDGCSATCEWEGTTIADPGQTLALTGSFDGRMWDRPVMSCGSFVRKNPFAEYPLVNATPSPQTIRATVTGGFGQVMTLHAYAFPFDPALPGIGCVPGGLAFENQARTAKLVLQPGELVVLVVSLDSSQPSGTHVLQVTTSDRCGDGVVGASEACDVGHANGGDGCSADCRSQEPGFTCITPGQPCVADVCGDGLVGGGEECDDGGADLGGCTQACSLEPGWACPVSGAACREIVCGDGHVDAPETCDDGNTTSGDGCDSTCQLEFITPTGETSPFPSATVPVGRYVRSRIATGREMLYFSFPAVASRTYTIETFVGSPGSCDVPPGAGTGIYLQNGFTKIGTDGFSGIDGCSRIVWTAPASGTYGAWVFGIGSVTLDPFYLLIRETP